MSAIRANPSLRPALPDAQAFIHFPAQPALPCLCAGQGAPVVLVHGALCDARYWWPQLPALARQHRVIAPSLRHYWPQTVPENWPTLDWQRDLEDLAALIAALPERRADVIGHSRGGFIACQLALAYPERVRRLILAEPGGTAPGEASGNAQAQRRRALWPLLQAGQTETAVERFVDGVSQPGVWRFSPAAFRRIALDNAHTLPGLLDDSLPAYERQQLGALAGPVLLIYGQRTRARFKAIVELLADHIRDAQVQAIAGAAHGMNLAHPRAFNEAVLAFLQVKT